jgi:hypothetical protein
MITITPILIIKWIHRIKKKFHQGGLRPGKFNNIIQRTLEKVLYLTIELYPKCLHIAISELKMFS